MADNKEIVRAIEKMSRDVCKTLNDIGKQMNKALGKMADNMEQKQFDEWYPPEIGTAVQNLKGCVMLNAVDFNELVRETDEDEE